MWRVSQGGVSCTVTHTPEDYREGRDYPHPHPPSHLCSHYYGPGLGASTCTLPHATFIIITTIHHVHHNQHHNFPHYPSILLSAKRREVHTGFTVFNLCSLVVVVDGLSVWLWCCPNHKNISLVSSNRVYCLFSVTRWWRQCSKNLGSPFGPKFIPFFSTMLSFFLLFNLCLLAFLSIRLLHSLLRFPSPQFPLL